MRQMTLFGCQDCGESDTHLVSAYDSLGSHNVCESCRSKNYSLDDWFKLIIPELITSD